MLIISTQLLLLFTNIVTNSASEDLSVQQTVTPNYRYNHPPSFETHEVFPEADDFEVRKVRGVENYQNNDYKSETKTKKLNTEENIPVEILYEAAPIKLRSNNKVQTNNTVTKGKRRKNLRRQNVTPKENITTELREITLSTTEKVSVTEATLQTSSTKTIVPKVFTRRPPEDNPVIKKIREREPVIKIVENTNLVYAHSGNFHYSFEGADGTKVSSVGELKSFDDDKTGESVTGEVSYKDNEGNDFSFSYTADENGYRPHGAHLPTPPPIPPAIARALKYLATKTTPAPVTEPTKKIAQ